MAPPGMLSALAVGVLLLSSTLGVMGTCPEGDTELNPPECDSAPPNCSIQPNGACCCTREQPPTALS